MPIEWHRCLRRLAIPQLRLPNERRPRQHYALSYTIFSATGMNTNPARILCGQIDFTRDAFRPTLFE